jgi:CRP-like cAMP-binding protein
VQPLRPDVRERVLSGNGDIAPESGSGRNAEAGDQSAERNRILRGLPADEYAFLLPHLTSLNLDAKYVLADAGEPYRYVYFIETGVASVVNHVDGGVVEVGTIGNEGVAGLSVFLDGGEEASRTFMQVPGAGKRMPAEIFRDHAEARPALRRILKRYTQAFLIQVAQTAACNRAHLLEERCARWLLMTHDRMEETDSFPLTHQFLAYMLGVRRSGVTIAAGALQEAGLIRYTRGRITITDRERLEEASCECYEIVRRHFDRLLR